MTETGAQNVSVDEMKAYGWLTRPGHLFCWLFTIKDCCKKSVFFYKHLTMFASVAFDGVLVSS